MGHLGGERGRSPALQRASPWGAPVVFATALLTATAAVASLLGAPVSHWLLLVGLLLIVAGVTRGVIDQSSGVFARPVLAVHTARPELALTFDDGPDPVHTRSILDALEARGHRGTFFVIGDRAAHHPELLAEMARRGHEIANHSLHHSYVTNLVPSRKLARELETANEIIGEATGTTPRWFRPPVGLLSPRIATAVQLTRLELVAWTATARDGTKARTVEEAVARMQPWLRPGAILVLHDAALHGDRTPIALAVLHEVLDAMEQRGLRSVTLSQLVSP